MKLVIALVALAIVAAGAAPARADNKAEAETLFKKGKRLVAAKKFADACAAFEKSDKLDPGIGTKLNIARCYEEWGMLARAVTWYETAEQAATAASDKRADKIRELIETVDAEVPRLIIKLPEGADAEAAGVKVDGKALPVAQLGKAHRVDPGPHEISWLVEGARRSKTIPAQRGGEHELALDMRPVKTPGSGRTRVAKVETPRPGRTRRILGLSMGVAGVVGLGIAGYLTLDARSSYNDALDAHCMGMKNACDDEGLSLTGDARTRANTATVISLVSLAVAAGGVVLYLTAPSKTESQERSALYLTPMIGADTGGLVVGGGF